MARPGTDHHPWRRIGLVICVVAALVPGILRLLSEAAPETEPEPVATDTRSAAALVRAARERTRHRVRYDPAYVVIDYPGGDVPAGTGVCSDVVVRSYRELGVDLQKLVHEDMEAAFGKYPRRWNLARPDPNIDHRRVANLQRFLERHGRSLERSEDPEDYRPGDLVAWDLNGNDLRHIGIVFGRDRFVHNIGAGPVEDTGLFQWKIIGHYRYPR